MFSELKLTDYIPHKPTPKQRAFLMLPSREAFFGGAAGGGKSDALLMGALQYCDIPGYSSLVLRKTLSELKLPGGLLERATEWLAPFIEEKLVRYVPGEHTYYFPTHNRAGETTSPAKLTFGYIGESNAFTRYQGSEWQYVGFDEATHFTEYDYTYLFSRLRKNVCKKHADRDEEGDPIYRSDCEVCQQQKHLPLRIRAASNPGGLGHRWVKERFRIEWSEPHSQWTGTYPGRPFIPAFLTDNPYLDQKNYSIGLEELEEITRKQLKQGDWGASAGSRFKISDLREYTYSGSRYRIGGPKGRIVSPADFLRVFQTLDPASSTKEGPADDVIYQNTDRDFSWSVVSTWGLTKGYDLLWLDMWRDRVEIPDLLIEVAKQYNKWRPEYITCEANGPGRPVYQVLARKGYTVKPVVKITDKIANSTEAQLRMRQGRIYLPFEAHWVKSVRDEIFSWVGHPHETDDIVDTLSDAAREVSWDAMDHGEDHQVDPFSPHQDLQMIDAPMVIGNTGTSLRMGESNPDWFTGSY